MTLTAGPVIVLLALAIVAPAMAGTPRKLQRKLERALARAFKNFPR